jgi:uncharacterized membrane protein YsdA (DUF1294 family)
MPSIRTVAIVYVIASIITFIAYGLDKFFATRSARSGLRRMRIAEQTLHLFELLGGWPGALIAQRIFRHKTSKRSYQVWFWLIAGVHGAGWIVWLVRRS